MARKIISLLLVMFLLVMSLYISGCVIVEEKAEKPSENSIPLPETPLVGAVVVDNITESSEGETKFNVEIDLPQSYQQVSPGDELWFTTKLLNLANQKRIDVTLNYHILDSNRQLKYSKSETVAVETQASFVANLQTPTTLQPGLHFVKATLSSSFGQSEAETTFEVLEEETESRVVIKFSLFDIEVKIPEDYKTVFPGDELLTSIKLINVGSGGRIDIFLDYWITNEQGVILLEEKETVAVETQNNFVRTFAIPKDAAPGRYTFHAKVSYPGLELNPEYATNFTIAKKEVNKRMLIIGASLVGLILLILLVVRFSMIRSFFKNRNIKRKVSEIVKRRS